MLNFPTISKPGFVEWGCLVWTGDGITVYQNPSKFQARIKLAPDWPSVGRSRQGSHRLKRPKRRLGDGWLEWVFTHSLREVSWWATSMKLCSDRMKTPRMGDPLRVMKWNYPAFWFRKWKGPSFKWLSRELLYINGYELVSSCRLGLKNCKTLSFHCIFILFHSESTLSRSLNSVPQYLASLFWSVQLTAVQTSFLFPAVLKRENMKRYQDMLSGVVPLLFWLSRWGQPVVHPIRKIWQPLNAPWGGPTTIL